MNYEETMMQLILHGGNARGAAYEALDEAEEYKFEEAESKLEEANDEFLKGHKYQTELIQNENDGTVPSFFMIHAQDHLMTAQAELALIKRLIVQLKKTQAIEARLEAVE